MDDAAVFTVPPRNLLATDVHAEEDGGDINDNGLLRYVGSPGLYWSQLRDGGNGERKASTAGKNEGGRYEECHRQTLPGVSGDVDGCDIKAH